jgi:hypothetical protein
MKRWQQTLGGATLCAVLALGAGTGTAVASPGPVAHWGSTR